MTFNVKEKTIYLMGGLPRSGSTLLMNILGQNPKFYVTSTSGLAQLLTSVRDNWNQIESIKALGSELSDEMQKNVMRSILYGWFKHTDKSVCIDKYHFWPNRLETIAALLGDRERVKILIMVRDLRDVVASFEKVHRKTTALGLTSQEEAHDAQFKTAKGRISLFIDDAQPVGRAFNAIRDAATRGWLDRMHFVEYEQFTHDPNQGMERIYEFLEEEPFLHNFDHVEQITYENDRIYRMKDLHAIQHKVNPAAPQWPHVFDATVLHDPVWKDIEKLAQFWKAYSAAPKPKEESLLGKCQ